jgi:quaternary ammonium compound-resistance protein SugE
MTTQAAWFLLVLAGVLEIVWAVGLKMTEGFTRPWPSVVTVVAMALSIAVLAQVVRVLPISTAYAVWTGIGAVGTALIGIAFFGEPSGVLRLACITMIVVGTLGLKFAV